MICKDHYFTEGYFSNIIKVTIHNSSDVIIIETNNTLINDKNDNDNSQKMIKYSLIIEEAMKEILEKKDINEKSDFFLEGGNSILAMKLVLQLEEAGLQIELEDIYNLRTPIKISKRVSKNS